LTETRRRIPAKEKEEIASSQNCYVCEGLDLDHAGFDGYDMKDIDFDHYQTPFGNVGSGGTEVLPIHGFTSGSTPDDPDFEIATQRDCHKLRGNNYNSRAAYVRAMRARMAIRTVNYVDDVYENSQRDEKDRRYILPVKWDDAEAEFVGKKYPLAIETRGTKVWRRFLTTLRPELLFTDQTSQVRQAAKKTLHKMVHTYMVDGFPTLAPVNARIDKCGHVVIYDGNHRATAHALAFGLKEPVPVQIWDIASDANCVVRSSLTGARAKGDSK
jgi:hypothetical protein